MSATTQSTAERVGAVVGRMLRWFPLVGLLFAVLLLFPRYRSIAGAFFALFGVLFWVQITLFLWVVKSAGRK